MVKFTHFLAFTLLVLHSPFASAQLYEVSLDKKVQNSSLIVEGRVLDQHCFWGPGRQMIYTASKVEVYKSFKGQLQQSTIEIVTPGGAMEDRVVQVDHLGSLEPRQTALFFLQDAWQQMTDPQNGERLYGLYAAEQSVITYDLLSNKASCPFADYDGITTTLYKNVQAKTGLAFTEIKPTNIDNEIARFAVPRQQSHNISGFSPASVVGGALLNPTINVLTINGTGFSNTPTSAHKVLFRDGNANNNNPTIEIPFNDAHIINWTDNQITLRTPARASTGRLAVTIGIGDTAFAANNLIVSSSVLTVRFNNGVLNEPRLVADNGAFGGYSVFYSTGTSGGGANITTSPVFPVVQRALATWRERGGGNLLEGGNTISQAVANDAQNIIMLDNTNTGVAPLAEGVLGACFNQFLSCNTSTNNAQKADFDIVIRNQGVSAGSTNFDNGPCAPSFTDPQRTDMETIIFHELGHALNLAHVNEPFQISTDPNFQFVNFVNPSGVMHYALTPWVVRRSLDAPSLAGLAHTTIPVGGVSLGVCAATQQMTPTPIMAPDNDGCPAVFPATPTPIGTIWSIDLKNATSNKGQDPGFVQLLANQPTFGVSITNNVYQTVRTSNTGTLTFTVAEYATYPAEVATTCGNEQGVLVTAYQVNSCPTGQTFPSPSAHFLIQGNTAVTLNNLPANINLLLVINGFRNTKASFRMTLSGTALPIVLANFSGRKLANGTNELTADISSAENVREIAVERGISLGQFEPFAFLKQKANNSYAGLHTIIDPQPANGVNFYRLKTTDNDGKITLSQIVTIDNRVNDRSITVSPNPFQSQIQLNNLPETIEGLNLRIMDSQGKIILARNLGTRGGNVSIAAPTQVAGMYLLQIIDKQGIVVYSEKILKQ